MHDRVNDACLTDAEAPWLDVVGIGEDGEAGLSPAALEVVQKAEVIIGGDRHHSLTTNTNVERISWPSPFDAMIETIRNHKGKRLVVLVTGDPLWYSVGARITKSIAANEIRFHPQLSAFQLAACRLGWSLADVDTVTVHGRAASQVVPFIVPNAKLLVLTQNGSTPAVIAEILCDRGFGKSALTVLAAMGGSREQRHEGIAENWDIQVPDFHLLAIECVEDNASFWFPRTGGLPDSAFIHDGKLTKQEVRAGTIAKLKPYPDALLWDVGAGCGSVAIEWMRAARGALAIAIDPVASRREMIEANARALGTEKLKIVAGTAPDCLEGLGQPDAIFIGGGLNTEGVFEACWHALRPLGHLAVNAVTLESASKLHELHGKYGGELVQISVSRAIPVGQFRGWKPSMPVTQWSVQKPLPQREFK